MNKYIKYLLILATTFLLNGCSVKYGFTGAGKIDAKTFQVNYFQNNASLIEPGIDRTFTLALQDIIQNQTNLNLTNTDGELFYEGEIVDYYFSPMTGTSDQKAAQSRLTIGVLVRFVNKNKEADNFEKRFSFFRDYDGVESPTGATLNGYINEIFTRITQDIFNESLAKW